METFTRTLRPRNWTRKRINRELKAVGRKQADLMRQLGKSRALVSEVVSGKQKSLPVATAIAAALGRQPHEIWPRLYAAPAPIEAPIEAPNSAPTPEPAPIAHAS